MKTIDKIKKIMSGQLGGIRCLKCGYGDTVESAFNDINNSDWYLDGKGPKCPKCNSEDTVSGVHISVDK